MLLRERAALDLRLRAGALFLLPELERSGATFLPLVFTLWRNASMRSMTFPRSSRSAGGSIVLPAALRFTSLRSASSYSSLNCEASNRPAFLSRMWLARSTISFVMRGLPRPTEKLFLVPHFVVVAQRRPQHALAPGLDSKDMLTLRKNDACERNAPLVLHRVPDDSEGFLAALVFRYEVVRALVIALVDVFLGHEFVDVYGVRAFDLDGLELLWLDLDILAVAELIAATFVLLVDDATGVFVHHLLAQAVPGLAVDLVEARLFGLR